ncbi:F0F1 ATP synthase subunit gamma [Candidatus Dependentiae bacterium]|nr:F0F1 ATP synthase subunit gamma [Candidatus Dependentiae bacterium]
MAQLVQMRQRIKTIETIKKVTNAMRLISMSSHTKMQAKRKILNHYTETIKNLFYKLRKSTPSWRNRILMPNPELPQKTLFILIGSQKGLCGNFSSALFSYFTNNVEKDQYQNATLVAIGKKATDYVRGLKGIKVNTKHEKISINQIEPISTAIISMIMDTDTPFTSVVIFSNKIKNFFIQKPSSTQLIPLGQESITVEPRINEPYVWEQPPEELLGYLSHELLHTMVYNLLFESLIAEQAARFISMDNSTRNAQTILDTTKLAYNKLRQMKITRELTEITGALH